MSVCEDENDEVVIGTDEVSVCGIDELADVRGDVNIVVAVFSVELPMV